MAKGTGKSTTWISLSEAEARAVEAFAKTVGRHHAPEFARRHILKGLLSGQIRWRCRHVEGSEQELVGRPEFFFDKPTAGEDRKDLSMLRMGIFNGPPAEYVTIDWTNSSAHRAGTKCYLIEIADNDLALPWTDAGDDDPTVAKVWISREARSLKRAGKLDGVASKTEMARRIIAVGVGEKGLPEVGVDYIRDHVEDWGLWPIKKIT